MEIKLIPSAATSFTEPIFIRYSDYATGSTTEELFGFFWGQIDLSIFRSVQTGSGVSPVLLTFTGGSYPGAEATAV
jgi:hypothetical protein